MSRTNSLVELKALVERAYVKAVINGILDELLIINDTQLDKEDETDAVEEKTK